MEWHTHLQFPTCRIGYDRKSSTLYWQERVNGEWISQPVDSKGHSVLGQLKVNLVAIYLQAKKAPLRLYATNSRYVPAYRKCYKCDKYFFSEHIFNKACFSCYNKNSRHHHAKVCRMTMEKIR